MMRSKLVLLFAVAGMMFAPASVAVAQDASPCFSEGDGSIIGEPSPCPEETPTIGGPTEEPTNPASPEPPESETPNEQESNGPAPDDNARPQAQQAALADTGTDAGVLAFVAVGALGLGALSLVVSRWRRNDSSA